MSLSEPDKNDALTMKTISIPAVNMIEGRLPLTYMNELNAHIDENRHKRNDYSNHLVGQIKQHELSEQLDLDRNAPVVKSLLEILAVGGKRLIQSMSIFPFPPDQYDAIPVECFSAWTVHSYAGDYNPLHDHDVSYDKKVMSFSCILYCKVPPQIEAIDESNTSFYENSGVTDGSTHFVWGTNTSADYLTLRPRGDKFIKPEVGKFLVFPCWLKHQVFPFQGEGERTTLSANFKTEFRIDRLNNQESK